LSADSSGRAVAQSITALTPTIVAGRVVGSDRSACKWVWGSTSSIAPVRPLRGWRPTQGRFLCKPDRLLHILSRLKEVVGPTILGASPSVYHGFVGVLWECCTPPLLTPLACTVVAPHSRRKSAGVRRGRTMQRTA